MRTFFFQRHYSKLFIIVCLFILYSCGSTKQYYNPYEVQTLSQKLNIPLDHKNEADDKNIPLYVQCASWIGTKYRYGGNTKKGIDCSGMVKNIYSTVYNMTISRSTKTQFSESKKISKNKAVPGDLIFFSTNKKKNSPTHVGIYLKDDKFIHASSSKGVIVSSLNENYYTKYFMNFRRIK